MLPAFGFSVGDFISAIELIVKVTKALKSSGGATSEYRSLVEELGYLRLLLEQLQDIKPSASNLNHVNAIRGMALTFRVPLSEFLDRVEKYRTSMAAGNAGKPWQGLHRKSQWAVVMPGEISKLRTTITMKIVTVSLLLAMPLGESLSRLETSAMENQNLLKETNKTITQNTAYLSKTSQDHETAITTVKETIKTACSTNELSSRKLLEICAGVRQDIDRAQISMLSQRSLLSRQMRSIKREQSVTNTVVTSVSQAVRLYTGLTRRLIGEVLRRFGTFSVEVLEYLKKILNVNLEIYALLMQIQEHIPRGPSQVLSESIRFEDVLGRVRSLPYEYFRHWQVFESLLRHEFQGFPGQFRVEEGKYRIMNADLRGRVLGKDDWNRLVFPGTKLQMSIVVSTVLLDDRCVYPWCRGFSPRVQTSKWTTCQYCGNSYPKGHQQSGSADATVEDMEVFRRVHFPATLLDHAANSFSSGLEAWDIMLKEKESREVDLKHIVDTLPTMTNAEILKYRKEFGEVTLGKSRFDLPKYLRKQRTLGSFARDCQVLALGQWESEAYWIEDWHNYLAIRWSMINYDEYMSFIIEAILDRDSHELASIEVPLLHRHHELVTLKRSIQEQCKEASARKEQSDDYKPILEHHTLQEYVLSEVEDSDMRYLIIRAQATKVSTEEEDLLADRNRFLEALVAEDYPQRNKTLIDICIGRRECYIQSLFTLLEEEEVITELEASWGTLPDPLKEALSHIVRGAIDRPLRDATLLNESLESDLKRIPLTDKLTSRIIRLHWNLPHLEKVKISYKEEFQRELNYDIIRATFGPRRAFYLKLLGYTTFGVDVHISGVVKDICFRKYLKNSSAKY